MLTILQAGYDTTANTIIFSCVAMALFEDTQERVIEELDQVLRYSRSCGRDSLSYTEDFPRFRYLLAFLVCCPNQSLFTSANVGKYETLRVFPVVLPIGRVTSGVQSLRARTSLSHTPVSTSLKSDSISLPDNCGVVVNITGVHYNPLCWQEPHTFEPMRWLSKDPNAFVPSQAGASELDPEARVPNHERGTFLTFSEGPRACLGRRFAQAEFVAFFAEILQHHRLGLAVGVDRNEVEKLFRSCSAGSPITLAPPADVGLRLEKR
jgi:cytochrome P450